MICLVAIALSSSQRFFYLPTAPVYIWLTSLSNYRPTTWIAQREICGVAISHVGLKRDLGNVPPKVGTNSSGKVQPQASIAIVGLPQQVGNVVNIA
jgi:hypothetical protein